MANFGETEPRKRTSQTKSDLKRSVDYVNKEEKTEIESSNINHISENKLIEQMLDFNKGEQIINYITQNKKTSTRLITGINCTPESAFNEMMIIKKMHNKEGGRMFKHFYHSYSDKEKIDPTLAHEISLKLISRQNKFKDYQILAATHVDKGHIHTHLILNTVNIETGKKWQQANTFLTEMRKLSNEICEEYGLKFSYVNEKGGKYKSNSIDRGQLRAKEENRSWKHELLLTINECIKISKSKDEFIKNMEILGYKVKWEDRRKYITFTTPDGKNKCRNIKLEHPEKFTKEELLNRFELNQQIFDLSKDSTALEANTRNDVYKDKYSWKYPLFVAINDSLTTSISKDDFINQMDKQGFNVRWVDSRKDITFIFPDGRKCNNDKLHPPERYTKEALLKQFSLNKDKVDRKDNIDIRPNIPINEEPIIAIKNTIINTSRLLEHSPDNIGKKDYPLSYLEGQSQAIKEKIKEKAKGEGLDWEKDRYR